MTEVFPKLAIDVSKGPIASASALFPRAPSRIVVEIGFGGGEHLLAEAARDPDTGFIGVEPFLNGMAKAVTAIADGKLANVRLFAGDAALLLDALPAASLNAVDLLYPDPWPKKRHWKRRFVSKENLARLARVLRPGAVFHVASDIPGYIQWTLAHILGDERFDWPAERAADWTAPFPNWPGTRYEAKALAAGRVPTYLTFIRR